MRPRLITAENKFIDARPEPRRLASMRPRLITAENFSIVMLLEGGGPLQ